MAVVIHFPTDKTAKIIDGKWSSKIGILRRLLSKGFNYDRLDLYTPWPDYGSVCRHTWHG
jgi:hypothetical protein